MFLSRWHATFKKWKPIHLCWLFNKYGIPIPPYLIGTTPTLDQRNYIFAADDPETPGDPDSCTFDSENTPRTGQALDTALHVRIQVANDGAADAGNYNWSLWYDTDGTPATATQVTTDSAIIQLTNSVGGAALADNDACNTIKCTAQAETWVDGLYLETSDETGKLDLDASYYSEMQFCFQFLTGATGSYYFFLRGEGNNFTGTYDEVPQITVALATPAIDVSEAPGAADDAAPATGAFAVNVAECPKPIDTIK